jgi:hypothetical protein
MNMKEKFFKYWIQPWHPNHIQSNEERAWEMLKQAQGPGIWTGKDLFKAFLFGLFLGLLMLSPVLLADDNQISLEQSGNNLLLEIEQVGYNNQIGMLDSASYINNAPNLDIHIVQYNFTDNTNKILFDEVSGSNNTFKLAQGVAWTDSEDSYTYDGAEGGGHYMEIDLYGSNNSVKWHQSGATDGHNFNFHLAGDWNEVNGRQQSSGSKEMELTIYNDDNLVNMQQKGANATHSATVTLDGIYGTDLTLIQLGTTTQSYSLSQTCNTVGGCTVSVTQGQ